MRIKGQQNAPILGLLTAKQRSCRAPRLFFIGGLTVCTHDSAPCSDTGIEKHLHNFCLFAIVRQTDAVALPVAPSPLRLKRKCQARNFSQSTMVVLSEL